MRILRILRILLPSSTAANFGSCGIGGRGGSDSDIDSSDSAATFGPIGIGSRGSSDIDTGGRSSNGADGLSHGSRDTGGPTPGHSSSVTGYCWFGICDGPGCVRGG